MDYHYRKKTMEHYANMTPTQKRAEMKRRERNCKRIKLITIKIPVVLAVLFILWMFTAGGTSVGVSAILLTGVLGIPWCLFWNWIANSEVK